MCLIDAEREGLKRQKFSSSWRNLPSVVRELWTYLHSGSRLKLHLSITKEEGFKSVRVLDVFIIAILALQTFGLMILIRWGAQKPSKELDSQKFEDLVRSFRDLYAEMDSTVNAVVRSVDSVAANLHGRLGQIRAMAINGTIEASKDPERNKKIQQLFDEISRACSKAREDIDRLEAGAKNLNDLDDLVKRVASGAVVFSSSTRNKK